MLTNEVSFSSTEHKLAMKFMRQVSNVSKGSEDSLKDAKALERVLSRRLSHGKKDKEKDKKKVKSPKKVITSRFC